jgi:hypothetical protein
VVFIVSITILAAVEGVSVEEGGRVVAYIAG